MSPHPSPAELSPPRRSSWASWKAAERHATTVEQAASSQVWLQGFALPLEPAPDVGVPPWGLERARLLRSLTVRGRDSAVCVGPLSFPEALGASLLPPRPLTDGKGDSSVRCHPPRAQGPVPSVGESGGAVPVCQRTLLPAACALGPRGSLAVSLPGGTRQRKAV